MKHHQVLLVHARTLYNTAIDVSHLISALLAIMASII